MPEPVPSERVIKQRIRNRIIERLELASSFEVQREYEINAPAVNIPYEVINGWEDWIRPGCWPLAGDPAPLSEAELGAVKTFNEAWDLIADEVPDNYPTVAEVQMMEAWTRLREAAVVALEVFARRGSLSEDHEEQD